MTDNIPKTMHAVVLTGHGGLDKLEFHRDWPVPEPQSDEVLIRVAACGLNKTDVHTRSAWYSQGCLFYTPDPPDASPQVDPSVRRS